MNAEELSATAGVLLSLGFSYVPGLNERFDALEPTHKRLVMLALLALAAAASYGLACLGAPGLESSLACDQSGAWGLLRALLAAVVANQAAFTVSPRLNHANHCGQLASTDEE